MSAHAGSRRRRARGGAAGMGGGAAMLSQKNRILLRGSQTVAAIGLVAYALQASFAICGSAANDFFETYFYTGLIVVAAGLCLTRALAIPRERTAWLVLGLGLLAWAGGELYYSVSLQELGSPPVPSPSDALWLAFYPACYVAIVLLVRERARELRPSLWLDGIVGGLAAAAVGTAFVFDAVSGAGDGRAVAVDMAYLLGDVLLLGFVITVFALTGWRPGRPWALLGGGLLTSALVDGFFLHEAATGSAVGGTLVAVLWPASALIVGSAAWQRPARRVVDVDGWRVLALPAAFALVALGVLAYQMFEPLTPLAVGLAVATLMAMIVRMALTFRENLRLLEGTRREALTDPLTGLGNRRELMRHLEQAAAEATPDAPRALMLFDLDGFKDYNDRYGHPVGDALLARLGRSLQKAVRGAGAAYRLGGDEFSVIAAGTPDSLRDLAVEAAGALSDQGKGFDVRSSCGMALLPNDADDVTLALHLADERLYAQKGHSRRTAVKRQTSDALLQVLRECEPSIGNHLHEVARLARSVGLKLGLSTPELDELTRAAELHDIGKVAVPSAILRKPGPLDEIEWDFVREHTIVGDRILSAAPALNSVAKLVRASHEHFDGSGYPDGAAGEEIPLAARIVAACDAYHAMTSDRPYRQALDSAAAVKELRRCAGRQFDPMVVEVVCEVVAPAEAAAGSAFSLNGASTDAPQPRPA